MSGPFARHTAEESPVQLIMVYTPSPVYAMADMALVTNHHPRSTHLDALGHMVGDGHVFPGRPLDRSVTPAGAGHGSTAAFAEGIVTRGVLLDLAADGPLAPAYPVTATDLEAAEERQAVRLESGDALVVRCGWTMTSTPECPLPGITLDAVRWMHERGVSVYARGHRRRRTAAGYRGSGSAAPRRSAQVGPSPDRRRESRRPRRCLRPALPLQLPARCRATTHPRHDRGAG